LRRLRRHVAYRVDEQTYRSSFPSDLIDRGFPVLRQNVGHVVRLHAQARHSMGGDFHDRPFNGIEPGQHSLVRDHQVLVGLCQIANITVEFGYQRPKLVLKIG